jgi:hypothetical protein
MVKTITPKTQFVLFSLLGNRGFNPIHESNQTQV